MANPAVVNTSPVTASYVYGRRRAGSWINAGFLRQDRGSVRIIGTALRRTPYSRAWALATQLIPAFILLLTPILAATPPPYHAGITDRTIQPSRASYNWRGARTHALLTTIWYPVASNVAVEQRWIGSPASPFASAGRAAPNAVIAVRTGGFPLVLLSHGTGGSALMMAWLGTALAEAGFIAAAVNHPGNNGLEEYTPQGFTFWWERATDLSEVLTALQADSQIGSRIDPKRIGAAGFSLGGFTVIELAGGIGTHARFQQFCKSDRADDICRDQLEFPDLTNRVAALANTDEFRNANRESEQSHQDSRIRAVFAIAPALGPAFSADNLRQIGIPVAIISGAADRIVPVQSNARFFAKHVPAASLTIYPGRVAHYTFLGSCTALGKRIRPELCNDAPGIDRDAVHTRAAQEAVRFFRKHLPGS